MDNGNKVDLKGTGKVITPNVDRVEELVSSSPMGSGINYKNLTREESFGINEISKGVNFETTTTIQVTQPLSHFQDDLPKEVFVFKQYYDTRYWILDNTSNGAEFVVGAPMPVPEKTAEGILTGKVILTQSTHKSKGNGEILPFSFTTVDKAVLTIKRVFPLVKTLYLVTYFIDTDSNTLRSKVSEI